MLLGSSFIALTGVSQMEHILIILMQILLELRVMYPPPPIHKRGRKERGRFASQALIINTRTHNEWGLFETYVKWQFNHYLKLIIYWWNLSNILLHKSVKSRHTHFLLWFFFFWMPVSSNLKVNLSDLIPLKWAYAELLCSGNCNWDQKGNNLFLQLVLLIVVKTAARVKSDICH